MILKSLTLKNFKSYSAETFSFHDRCNLIIGENAQGKTNLLEAIHFLLAFKPFKQLRSEEVVSFGSTECRLKGEIQSQAGFDEINILLDENHKTLKLNSKVVYKTSKVSKRYNVVTFLPTDIDIVKGSAQVRRKYLDAIICSIDPAHLRDLKLYQRALGQRNAILVKPSSLTLDKIEVWDEQLAEIGSQVISRRVSFVNRIRPVLNKIYKQTSGLDQEIGIHYQSSIDLNSNIEQSFKDELKLKFEQDKKRFHTTVGPHRDKLSFSISEKDASIYSSQGEAKNLALALKVSEIEMINQFLGRTPILLLDDITSELDSNRIRFLFKLLQDFAGQIFITTTSMKEILYKGHIRGFHIKDGIIRQKDIQT
ncbi:MAG: DNA replication/repair protein RecF [Thermodesulfobacteriales bacterium]